MDGQKEHVQHTLKIVSLMLCMSSKAEHVCIHSSVSGKDPPQLRLLGLYHYN